MGLLRDKVSSNKYKNQIIEAVEFQNEASFYTTYDVSNPHIEIFKSRVREIYAGDKHKYDRFLKAFAGKILPSIELVETIYSQVYRVWDSQDRIREYNFSNKDLHDEALSYLGKFDNFWLRDFWEAYKHQFCSFVVVDLPTEKSQIPSPYLFVLDISRVIFIAPTMDWEVAEVIFKSIEQPSGYDKPTEFWYWYSDKFYSKYEIREDQEIEVFTVPHNLGSCPVHHLWNEKFNKSNWLLKKGLIVPNYDDLFWFIVKTVESRKADLLYLNPIKQEPKVSCNYKSKEDKEQRYSSGLYGDVECNGGWLYTIDGKTPVTENGQKVLCPNCGRSRHASGGAGNTIVIDLDTAAIRDGKVDPSASLVKFITPDIDGIKEQYQRLKDEKERITKHCVGSDDQPTKSAVNELQQTAIFESKESVLKRIAEQISFVKTYSDRDMLKLMYPETFISNRHNQGTKFYLHTVDELLEVREKAKDPIQKRQIDEQIIEVKYRNNSKKLNEEKLLYKLLPYSSLTDIEFSEMITSGRITDNVAISLRLQFSDAIELFESKYGSIIEYFTYKFAETVPEIQRVKVMKGLLTDNINIEKNVQNQFSGTPAT